MATDFFSDFKLEVYEYTDGKFTHRDATELDAIFASTPYEKRFKLAFIELVMDGIYPSGRQIHKKLGKNVNRKVNLNGDECKWKAELFELFKIQPYFGYSRKIYRPDWESTLKSNDFYLWRRKGHRLEFIGERR